MQSLHLKSIDRFEIIPEGGLLIFLEELFWLYSTYGL
ncbi:MAG: hypothetical protein K0S74_1325 [Chlamydiales bacterium]|jgi:hypothetical protein|nr:hypothetical protein [Chlamydiales bacterium]